MTVTTAMTGAQKPRIWSAPPYLLSLIDEAIDLCETAGLTLDEWEKFVLMHALGVRDDGLWSAFEIGLDVARQNGKGTILEARELVGLFLIPTDRLLIHTAHEFKTSSEHQRRLEELVQDTPEFHKRVKPRGYRHSHGEEGIELRDGKRIRFMTRTGGGGRGFSGDVVVFDEAMYLQARSVGALLPTLSARANPQIFYAGTAVDQQQNDAGVVFARVRERGHAGGDPRLAWFEWSAPEEHPDDLDEAKLADPARWAQANPSLGIRIPVEHIAAELRSMDPRTFAVERLGVGDWPDTTADGAARISAERWLELLDPRSKIVGAVSFAFDVRPDRSVSTIAVAGGRRDGLRHVEIVDRQRGTRWLPARLSSLVDAHDARAVVCDGASPAASLVHELEELGLEVEVLNAGEHARACGLLFDLVSETGARPGDPGGGLRHLGSPELTAALKGAKERPLGDAGWAWSRKLSGDVDISPLVAATLALWADATVDDDEDIGAMVVEV